MTERLTVKKRESEDVVRVKKKRIDRGMRWGAERALTCCYGVSRVKDAIRGVIF